MMSERCFEYSILEKTESELDSEGTPFLLVVWEHGREIAKPLSAYLYGPSLISMSRESDLEDQCAMALLKDLAYFREEKQLEAMGFFNTLLELSVGPIRTLVNGACVQEDLDQVLQVFFPGYKGGFAEFREVPFTQWHKSDSA